jgi:hypothetical protein
MRRNEADKQALVDATMRAIQKLEQAKKGEDGKIVI